MKIDKFNENNEYLDEEILDMFNADSSCIDSLFKKAGMFWHLSFLYENIEESEFKEITNIKNFIENYNDFLMSNFHENDKYAIEILFVLNIHQVNKLKDKIKLIQNTNKYNL